MAQAQKQDHLVSFVPYPPPPPTTPRHTAAGFPHVRSPPQDIEFAVHKSFIWPWDDMPSDKTTTSDKASWDQTPPARQAAKGGSGKKPGWLAGLFKCKCMAPASAARCITDTSLGLNSTTRSPKSVRALSAEKTNSVDGISPDKGAHNTVAALPGDAHDSHQDTHRVALTCLPKLPLPDHTCGAQPLQAPSAGGEGGLQTRLQTHSGDACSSTSTATERRTLATEITNLQSFDGNLAGDWNYGQNFGGPSKSSWPRLTLLDGSPAPPAKVRHFRELSSSCASPRSFMVPA